MNPFVKKIFFIAFFLLWSSGAAGQNTNSKPPIGQRFILSLPQTHNQSALESWLEKTKPAGILLESWHMRSRAKIKETIEFLQNTAQKIGIPPLLVTIDWEGGIVSRANESGGFVSVPAPHNLAQAGRSACFIAGKLIGQQLRSVGIDVNFAPSLDLFDQRNHVLASRCFSSDPGKILDCGLAFARGLWSEGVLPVIKHFPGLGLGWGDTHLVDIKIDFKAQDFARHTAPFIQALDHEMPAVMVSHAIYSHFDSKPASQSEVVANFLKKHNSNVLLITDDIAMMGFNNERKKIANLAHRNTTEKNKSFLDDVITSLKAGFHLLIFSEIAPKQCALIEKLHDLNAYQYLPEHAHIVAQQREIKKQLPQPTHQNERVLQEKKVARHLARLVHKQSNSIETRAKQNILLVSVDLPQIRPDENWFITEYQQKTKHSYTWKLLKKQVNRLDEVICDAKKETSAHQIAQIAQDLSNKKYDVVILQTFFYGQGRWNQQQSAWLKKLAPYVDQLIVVSLGHPYEQNLLGSSAQVIELGAFHKPDLEVACKRLLTPPLKVGANTLLQTARRFLKNRRFALLCHGCSYVTINQKEHFLPDILAQWAKKQNDDTTLAALFSPEHGLLGNAEAFAHIASNQTSSWGCPVHSLHGSVKQPTKEMLEDIDVLLIDLQDIGIRCYTYLSTMALTLEAAAKNNVEVIILNRPNPLKEWGCQGPQLDPSCASFVGKIQVPFLHGQTIGDLAKLVNKQCKAKLTVLDYFGDEASYFETNFKKPSPNIISLETLYAYPLTVFLEGTNYSEGRGTQTPFQQIGAPWVNAQQLANNLNEKQLPGVYFEPIEFTPTKMPGIAENPKHNEKKCEGVFIHIIDRDNVKPIQTSRIILSTLFSLYPQESQLLQWGKKYALDLLAGTQSWRDELEKEQQQAL